MQTSLRERFPALADGRAAFLAGFRRGITPPPRVNVADWAEQHRHVSPESGSPYPGKWSNARVPHLREVQEVLSLDDPATEVTAKKSAQVAFTEAGINLLGTTIHTQPSPILVLLPSISEVEKYAKIKLGTAIEATPVLRSRVRAQKSRDAEASTQGMLRFPGGFAVIGTGSSSKPLQMMSYRVVILEEVSEYPYDVDGRGDPVDLAYARTKAWRETRGAKLFYCSTPGIEGLCRITAKYEASDQRRYYVPCPQCGAFQVLKFELMKWESDTAPFGAHFVCQAAGCGGIIEHRHKPDIMERGLWLKTYPSAEGNPSPPPVVDPEAMGFWRSRSSGGRQPGFAIWQAYSPFNSWDGIVAEFLEAKKKGPEGMKVFTQQTLGEAWAEKGEAPDAERLFERRLAYPSRQLPPGALVVTGFCDVQADRLRWGVYAWAKGHPGRPTGYRIDGGTIPGDPEEDEVWKKLEQVLARRYPDARGAEWPIEAFGVDTGYLSHRVYLFCRRRADVYATDGRAASSEKKAWLMPPLGLPSKVDVDWRGQKIKKGCLLWPIGTWPLKSQHYAALRATMKGPFPDGSPRWGSLNFNEDADQALIKEAVAESLVRGERLGRPFQEWKKHGPNEELDIAVGSRALALHLGAGVLTDDQWQALAAQRAAAPTGGTGSLFDRPVAATAPAKAESDTASPATPAKGWLQPRKNWLKRDR